MMKKNGSFFHLLALAGFLGVVCTSQASAQSNSSKVPNFTDVVGTQLTNTNGAWVTFNPEYPNNIDLIETRIFKMPRKGSGVMGVEFKLVGADGGTARYQWGLNDKFSKGGGGGELNFTLHLQNTSHYDRPFIVTFGKKGESAAIHSNFYCSAGGGGSTGMSWLVPGAAPVDLNDRDFIAAAGGGSGGFSFVFGTLDGNSATRNGTSLIGYYDLENYVRTIYHNSSGTRIFYLVSGGSSLQKSSMIIPYCCTSELKQRAAMSLIYSGFSYQMGSGGSLQTVTHGQQGGRPTTVFMSAEGTTNYTGVGLEGGYRVTQLGGRGGAGFGGGGAGSSTTTADDLRTDAADIPTGGAGGTGATFYVSLAGKYPHTGEGGWNNYNTALVSNAGISPRAATDNPQSGKLMYRTITDSEPPQINISNITVTLKDGNTWVNYHPEVSLAEAMQPYLMQQAGLWDNDGIASVTATDASTPLTKFECYMAGQDVPVVLTVTDFAGNSTTSLVMARVVDPFKPVPRDEVSPDIYDPDYTRRINVSNGPVTLTAANFPTPYDGCKGSNGVTTHFPPTTFTCADAGEQPVSYYYTDRDGNQSQVYTKTFKVEYTPLDKIYVDAAATGANNGSSWTNAFTSLQDALRYGCAGNSGGREIYVAQGTYYPVDGAGIAFNDRNATFTLRDNDKLYGGFPNGGDVFDNRRPDAYLTILSGEVGNSFVTDNSYHVVTVSGSKTVLDGFTIRDGYADENAGSGGGGIKYQHAVAQHALEGSAAAVRHCKFLDNHGNDGGAIYTAPTGSAYVNFLRLDNCVFENNTTAAHGGAIRLNNEWMRLVTRNCVFNNNTAGNNGGALYVMTNGDAKLINNTFAYNHAGVGGGAIANLGFISLNNSILYFNTGPVNTQIANSGTFHIDYSNIQGSGGSDDWTLASNSIVDYGGNIDADPQFNPASPFSLMPQSPCRNAGKNSYNTEPFDTYGNTRICEDVIDMGAAECNPVLYVAWDAEPGGDGASWATAYSNLNEAMANAGTGWAQKSIWVKEGTYRPDRRTLSGGTPTPGNRENTFWLLGYARMYGGFAGTETQLGQRNIGQHPTILSGDIGVPGVQTDNVYHVVTAQGGGMRLDGFIVEGGYADGGSHLSDGAGYFDYASGPTINNVVANCVFRFNHAAGNGGAVYSELDQGSHGVTDFDHCLFYGNTAHRGAAAYIYTGVRVNLYNEFNFYNVTAVNNTSSAQGAGAFEGSEGRSDMPARIHAYNSLWAGNTPENYNDAGNPGHIILNNTYTAAAGAGVFVDSGDIPGADGKIMTADDGLRPDKNSPAINYGDTTYIYNSSGKDISGSNRIVQGLVDAGAYENWGCLGLTTLYVDANAGTAQGDGSSWAMAFRTFTDALAFSNQCPMVDSILIAKGTYYPGDPNTIISRDAAFEVWRPVKILGGYPSGGGIRDVAANPVVLDAGINTTSKEDNAVHIMRIGAGTADTTLIDGITFANGYGSGEGGIGIYTANGKSFRRGYGSAINTNGSTLHVNDCRFFNNHAGEGAAVYLNGGTFLSTRSIYDGNSAQNGGAVKAGGGQDTLRLRGNVFVRDTAFAGGGGAVSASYLHALAYTEVTNNIFVHNVGQQHGGGALYVSIGGFHISNNTFYANRSVTGGGVSVTANSNPGNVFANNSFWNNTNLYNNPDDYSVSDYINIVENNPTGIFPAYADTLNLLGPDGLWFTTDDGLRLKKTSPFVNQGSNAYAAGTKDITGAGRIQLGTVDIGAYESDEVVTRWYVSVAQDAAGADGISWTSAFAKLEDGIAAAKAGDTVWVAKGIYMPVPGAAFGMKSGVKIYGGFAGTEAGLSERDLGLGNNAILQGNGNSVIINTNVDSNALLDGFVLQHGSTAANGGGIRNVNSNAQFSNLVLVNNTATDGGAIANVNSQTNIHNAVFYGNEAAGNGGAIYDNASSTTILHAVFYHNRAANGAVLAQQDGSSFVMGNSISQGHTSAEWHSTGMASTLDITYSFLQKENNGAGNISGPDPKFSYAGNPAGFDGLWFTADDGLTATYHSVYVNKGDNALASAISKDITGAARIQNGTADMGAYENAALNFCDSLALSGSRLYVNAAVPASGSGLSWDSALKTLSEALEMANSCMSVDSILIAGGIYYPTGYQEADDRTQSFVISRGSLHLQGGYSSYDPASYSRNTGFYPTVLSGNINDNHLADDNSFHVVTLSNAGDHIALDGLIVSDGMADGTAPYDQGGGIYNLNASGVSVSNSIIKNNTAAYGSGFYNQSGNASFVNVAVTGNTATGEGGGFYSESGDPVFTNVTFAGNTASVTGSGAIGIASGAAQLRNSIVYGGIDGSYAAQYSLVEGDFQQGSPSGRSQAHTPDDVFNAPDNGDYMLKSGSPAIDAGSNDLYAGLNQNTRDLAGSPRLAGTAIDLGAYESPAGVLPVRWLSFEGRLSDRHQAVLTWKMEETNVSHYEVERSADARDFRIAGSVAAGGTGSGNYSFTDPIPVSGTVYYRIRQVDIDGTFSYSHIISIRSAGNTALRAFPNPAQETVTLELGDGHIGSQVRLISTMGVVLQEITVKERVLSIPLEGYPAGVYLLHTADGKVVRVVKE